MFCTFTTEHGTLIVRTEDVRRIQDRPGGTRLVWVEEDARQEATISGAAADNLQRLKDEEWAAYVVNQQRQQAAQPRPPMQPPQMPVTRSGLPKRPR